MRNPPEEITWEFTVLGDKFAPEGEALSVGSTYVWTGTEEQARTWVRGHQVTARPKPKPKSKTRRKKRDD